MIKGRICESKFSIYLAKEVKQVTMEHTTAL
jgi:hypothetical protein